MGHKLSDGSRRGHLVERRCQYPLSGSSASLGISLAPGVSSLLARQLASVLLD